MFESVTYPLAFTLGLFSTMHCLGMCGGIMGALTCGIPQQTAAQPLKRNSLVLLFNVGRTLSYGVMGLIAGIVGSGLAASINPEAWRTTASIAAAASLILLGLYLTDWFPQIKKIDLLGKHLWRKLQPLSRHFIPVSSPARALNSGLVWGWLPCGLVYYALILAITLGNPVSSALFMLTFGLGTLPALLATGMFSSVLVKLTQHKRVRHLAALSIVIFGLLTLYMSRSDLSHQHAHAPGTVCTDENR